MMKRHRWHRWVVLAAIVLSVCSCGRFLNRGAAPSPAAGGAAAEESRAELEAKLRNVVRGHVEAAESSEGEGKARLVKRTPYYVKEYAVYPDGPDAIELAIREAESRTVPYLADVTLKKQRYSTDLHRKKADARADSVLFRGTGVELLTYELRDGKWVKLGSLFVADQVEEYVNGEWVPVQEAVDHLVAEEKAEEEGWLGRAWSSITGR
ncbi:MAG: hypothetical protein JXR94_08230 [Candidatus Hydrogenedentes bacterium]|nr:hypothetical protein [Candidatus Hydrogenedentota bacterium]